MDTRKGKAEKMRERKYNLETAKVGDEVLEMSGAKLKVVYVSPTAVVTEFENGSIFTYAKTNSAAYLLYEVPLAWLGEDPIYAGDSIYLSFPGKCDSVFIVYRVYNGALRSTTGGWITLDKNKQIMESTTEYTFSLVPLADRIQVNGIDVFAPEKEAPRSGHIYFVSDPTNSNWYYTSNWYGDYSDNKYLERRLVHLTKDNAIAYAKAMVSAGEKHGK